jgi:hypothetical protein
LALSYSAQRTFLICSIIRAEGAGGRLFSPEANPSCTHPGSCLFTNSFILVLTRVTFSAVSPSTTVLRSPPYCKASATHSSCDLLCCWTWPWSLSRSFQ